MSITDFEITEFKDKHSEYLRIKYIGENKDIDKCDCVIDKRYATYNLLKTLIDEKTINKNGTT